MTVEMLERPRSRVEVPLIDIISSPSADIWPDVSDLVTEDDTPVDNFFSEKQQRLLTESLYSSWDGGTEKRQFLAAADVALYNVRRNDPLVPDVFLSLDVQVAEDWHQKGNRTYFFWKFGKPPEVVIEFVFDKEEDEYEHKLMEYGRMGIHHVIIFDPMKQLSNKLLRVYELGWRRHREVNSGWLSSVGLGVQLWQGKYEGMKALWLRWCDKDGNLILTEAEGADRGKVDRAQAEARRCAEAEEKARLEARRRAEAEEKAQLQADARIAAEAELARLRALLAKHNLAE